MENYSLQQTLLYKEIHEQPLVIEKLVNLESDAIDSLVQAIQERGVTEVVIAARGTSDNAARYAKYLLGTKNQLQVALATPSLYSIYKRPPKLHNALVIGISQSGKSPDIIRVVEESRRQGMLTASITNDPQSPLAQVSEHVIFLHAGEERSIAATKTYTSELVAIGLISAKLANNDEMQKILTGSHALVSEMLKVENLIKGIVQRYLKTRYCVVIGRGYNYATAFEFALKMKELTYTVVEPYSSADFQHGPLALVESGFPVFIIAPKGAMIEEMKLLIKKLQELQADIVAISDHPEILGEAHVPIQLPVTVPEWFSPVTSIIPGQMFAMYLAYARGFNVDKPRAIKKVTETI